MDFKSIANNVNSALKWFNPYYSGQQAGTWLGNQYKNSWLNPTYTGTKIGTAVGQVNNAINDRQEAYNSAEAEKQRDWQTEMSNTEVQRRVADINAAGLNPWLAISGGGMGSASTPSGAAASTNSAFANTYALTNTNQTLVGAIVKMASSAMGLVGNLAKLAAAA